MWTELLFRLRALLRRGAAESDLDDELAFHLEHEAGKLIRRGLSPGEARRQALISMGGAAQIREQVRDEWIWRWCRDVVQDVRYSVRALRQSPTFTIVAVLSLALGIGANTAIFSILNAVILKPLPVLDPPSLAHLFEGGNDEFTNAIWEQVRDRVDVFSSAFAYSHTDFDLAAGGERRPAKGIYASGDYFRTLGIAPQLGRVLTKADDRRGAPAVAVLSYGFWQRAYGGDRNVAGRVIRLNSHPFEIVGVTPRSFSGLDIGSTFDVIVPLASEALIDVEHPALDGRSNWWLTIVGRLKPGVGFPQANARLAALAPSIFRAAMDPDMPREEQEQFVTQNRLDLKPAAGLSNLRDQYGNSLFVLMGIAGLVLLIACVNIANLLLARSGAREREIAVRLAMGAGRFRLVRQLLTESLVLALAGAACGAAVAQWAGPAIVSLISWQGESLYLDVTPDLRVLLFAVAAGILTAILFGLAPALKATRSVTAESLKQTARSMTGRHGGWSLGRVLVVAQVALSMLLLVGAGLFTGTLRNLSHQDLGFRSENILLVDPDLRPANYSPERARAVADDFLARLRDLPGVKAAARAAVTPISGGSWQWDVHVDQPGTGRKNEHIYVNIVSPRYFDALQMPLLRGRDFSAADTKEAPHVAIINQTAAREMFPGEDPVGKVYYDATMDRERKEFAVQVIGLAGDAKYLSLRAAAPATVYLPMPQNPSPMPITGTYELRFAGSPLAVVDGVKDVARVVGPRISLRFTFLSRQIANSLMQERLVAILASFFGVLALILASAGLYGVVAYSASRRRSEVAIRLALGASRAGVLQLMIRDLAMLVLVGMPLGLAASWVCGRYVRNMLFQLTSGDPWTLAGASVVMLIVAFTAGFIPAHRAARLDPVAALREE